MMSQPGYLTSRETEIIRILRILYEATDGFVVIGGYAVNAYGHHRFSVDCELASRRDDVPVIDATLLREGYELRKSEVRPPIGVTIREYAKSVGRETVLVELLVDTVVNTTTRGIWTYKFIRENSIEAIVAGATSSTPSRVTQRNLLVAMKIHGGRTEDFEDIVTLSEKVDWKAVARCAACGSKEQLIRQIDFAIGEISSPKFVSDLKTNFAMRNDPTPLVKQTGFDLRALRTLVGQEKFRESL